MPIRIQGTPWPKEMEVFLQETKRQAFVCLTHIVQPTVELLLENLPPRVKLRVLVRIDKITLHAESLKRLIDRPNCEVRVLKNLNSKIYLLDGELAVLAGSNLTRDGLEHNVSFDVVVDDRKAAGELLARLEQYWKGAEEVKDVSAALQSKSQAYGAWVDPLRAKAIEFLSYEDVLVERLRTKLAENPDDAGSHRRLGDLLRIRGDRAAAMEAYRRALSLDEDLNEARVSLAKCLWEHGDPEHCLEEVFEVLKRDKANADAYYLSAIVYEKRGEESMAMAARREYERLTGGKASAEQVKK
jgi:tetratricopeptide (TPR) repeat protein